MKARFDSELPMVGDYVELDYLQGATWEITSVEGQWLFLRLVVGDVAEYARERRESMLRVSRVLEPLEVLAIAGHIPGMDGVRN